MMYYIARFLLWLSGWKMEGTVPDIPKFVMIAAPHTSSWDAFYMLVMIAIYRLKIRFMMKREMFRGPLGAFFRAMGGIPIDRSKAYNMVDQCVQMFNDNERFVVVVPPEGTRGRARHWKTGFYYIALGANVPIVLGFLDYTRKVGGVGPLFHPTGDIEQDMTHIREFYSGIRGKYPDLFGEIDVKKSS